MYFGPAQQICCAGLCFLSGVWHRQCPGLMIYNETMKYAIYLPTYTPYDRPQIIAAVAREAEEAGWDGCFIWDDVAGYGTDLADPWVSLAAAATTTQRIRLGALITPIARRRPWKVARETASLDHLSGGRLVFGAGVGSGSEQFGDLGDEDNQRVRGEMTDEALEVLSGLWSGENFQYSGKHYQIKPTRFPAAAGAAAPHT
jgi:alkanesulfonate monooxygenase SsuD/methylene tetrahydromethanopterin reductase-like flavin-dependent oxidoreductase (luciferase family)